MTEFDVKPSALDTYAGVLGTGRHAIDLDTAFSSSALSYVNSYSTLPAGSGQLFQAIYNANDNVVAHLQEILPKIGSLYAASSTALEVSAQNYRTTDEQASETIDAAYPGVFAVTALTDPPSGSAGLVDPVPLLDGEPSKDAPIPDPVQWIMDKSGWLSISGLVLKLASLFGLNPAQELTEAFLGEYGELAQAGHAAEALAAFERQAAYTMATGLGDMTGEWSGRAADAATSYFHEFANALHEHADQLDTLGEKYALLVQACAEIAEIVGGLLATALDYLLILAADIAAAGCLASVPGINVIIALVGAYAVWKTQQAVAAFIRICGNVTMATQGFIGLTLFLAQFAKDGSLEAGFPSAPYANGAQS